ncbi:hypothetical protein MLD38_039593 [Melastoma candidum]|uniref:Uncharacterized protein n=1 Tax=Melastoma candidum TaxID=119954 RepID=A0ACB9L3B4_9MYRT|nr:hypothetical protein MLD38_039593 [Melastoma candidum]
MSMWNEMGNTNTSLKEEGDVSTEATSRSPAVDAPEEAEAVLQVAEEVRTADGAQEETEQDAVGRDDINHESQQTLVEKLADPPPEAEESALGSEGETGLMDGHASADMLERNKQVHNDTPPEVSEESNHLEHEDDWKGRLTSPSACLNVEDTTRENEPVDDGTERPTEIWSNHTGTETSVVGMRELLGPAEFKAGVSSAPDELGLMNEKRCAIGNLPSPANNDDSPVETDSPVDEIIITREDDANLGEKEDNSVAEMKSLEMGEPGDPAQIGGEVPASKEILRSNSFSSLDSDNDILDRDRSIPLLPDDTSVKDESVVLVKPADLIGIPLTSDISEDGGHFECEDKQSPSIEAPHSDIKNTDSLNEIDGDWKRPVGEEGASQVVKTTEFSSVVSESFLTPREECLVISTLDKSTPPEPEVVIDGIPEAPKSTENGNSEIMLDALATYKDFQAFDPLKLNRPILPPPNIGEAALNVGYIVGSGLSREDEEMLDSQSQGSKPDKAVVNLRIKKSPSFDFDLRITRTEESDRTPLLFQDKRVVRSATVMTEQNKLPIHTERVVSFGQADSRTPSLGFSREEQDSVAFHNSGLPEMQEKALLLGAAKELEVVDGPSSPERKGKRRPKPSLFGSCMCCATVIN